MGQIRNIFLVLIFSLGLVCYGFGQNGKGGGQSNRPPQPQNKSHDGPPCDPGTGGGGTPPPPGLCLPIDDYLYLLMGVGAMYGCYKLRDFGTSQPNS